VRPTGCLDQWLLVQQLAPSSWASQLRSFLTQVKNGNHLQFDQSDCPLSPGESVQESGIYEICHADEPRISVLLLRNSFFPYCKRCKDRVRYKLIQAAPHISEDPDFLEDFPEPDNPTSKLTAPNNASPLQLGIAHGFRFWQQIVPAWGGGSDSGDL
jgi:hypothetical protein